MTVDGFHIPFYVFRIAHQRQWYVLNSNNIILNLTVKQQRILAATTTHLRSIVQSDLFFEVILCFKFDSIFAH